MDTRTEQIAQLLQETGAAHHQAYLAEDGADPEWPLWYAAHVYKRLASLLGEGFTRSEFVYALVYLDRRFQDEAPDIPWPEFYAHFLVDEYG